MGHPPTLKWFLVYVVTLCSLPYALCYLLIISDNGGCKLQKIKKRTLKIARSRERKEEKLTMSVSQKRALEEREGLSIFLPS